MALSTVPEFFKYQKVFDIFEYVFVFIFSIEYIGRIIGSEKPLKYIFSIWGFIDLVAVVPTFINLPNTTYLKIFRSLRLLKFLRTIKNNLKNKEKILSITIEVYLTILFISSVFISILIFIFEKNSQIAVFSSIPSSFLWSLKVLMGGVSQAQPLTFPGNFLVVISRFIGLFLFAILVNYVLFFLKSLKKKN